MSSIFLKKYITFDVLLVYTHSFCSHYLQYQLLYNMYCNMNSLIYVWYKGKIMEQQNNINDAD